MNLQALHEREDIELNCGGRTKRETPAQNPIVRLLFVLIEFFSYYVFYYISEVVANIALLINP